MRLQGRRLPSRFAKSIDRNLILANIYDPIFPGGPCETAACGSPIARGAMTRLRRPSTDGTSREGAAISNRRWLKGRRRVLGQGWVLRRSMDHQLWQPRRESTQALMIPELQAEGFTASRTNAMPPAIPAAPAIAQYDMDMYITPPVRTHGYRPWRDRRFGPDKNNRARISVGQRGASALMTNPTRRDETARATHPPDCGIMAEMR